MGKFVCISIGVLICLCMGPRASAAAYEAKNILVLYSFSIRYALDPVESQEEAVRSRVEGPVNFYVEYMESQRFEDPDYDKKLAETLQDAYRGLKIDLVIASYPALDFAIRHRRELFPGAPIVFRDLNAGRLSERKNWSNVTGVLVQNDIPGTINLALRLHPDANTIAIVTGASRFEKFSLDNVHTDLVRNHADINEVDLVGLSTDNLLRAVANLPPHSIVLFQIAPLDSVRMAVGINDLVGIIGRRVPTYCIWPVFCLDHGGIGGEYSDEVEQSALTASLAARVLSGEAPDNIPIVSGSRPRIRLDWRQLRYWHIPESALPPGSLILYREQTLWERDRKYFIPGLGLILAQGLLIAGLLWQRARKRKAEAVLHESEERFRVMADTTPSLIWMCDERGKITYLNEQWIAFSGSDPNEGYGDAWIEFVHPDDVQRVLEALWQALKDKRSFSKEYRLRRADGVYRWMFDVASPRINKDGSLAGFIGSVIDVTDQKLAQHALEKVSGQLIEAQEKERSRIARELHDDICQRLALLSMELEQAKRVRIDSAAAARIHLEEIRKHCAEITDDVQSLSHQLHSSRLDYLGITVAIQGFCREFSKKHLVNVEFSEKDVPGNISNEVSLGLFRIAQEALHNSVKYSGAKEFKVELFRSGDDIQLTVTDAGVGFDVQDARRKGGLGLLSMQERVNLIHGKLTVESAPGFGTKVIAIVPVVSQESPTEERTVEDYPT